MPNISPFGLDAMGHALAHRYLEAGYTTTVWNRTASKAHSSGLTKKGAREALAVAEGLKAADLIILCLLNNASLSDWITFHGAEYIHGGIMAVPDMVSSGSPHSVLRYSGDHDVFKRIESHLAHLGVSKFLGPDPGSASLHDLALLSGMYGLFSGFLHATTLARSGQSDLLVKQIDSGDYATQGSNLAMQVAGVENIVTASEDAGVTAAFRRTIHGLMKKAVQERFGGADASAVIEFAGVSDAEKESDV
ncbi:hypothetical protein BDV09DRAFT_206118 [Aspergillus tetrazonus]